MFTLNAFSNKSNYKASLYQSYDIGFFYVKNPMFRNVTPIHLASLPTQRVPNTALTSLSYHLWLCHPLLTTCRVFYCTVYSSTLRTDVTMFSEKINLYQTTRCHIPEDGKTPYSPLCEPKMCACKRLHYSCQYPS